MAAVSPSDYTGTVTISELPLPGVTPPGSTTNPITVTPTPSYSAWDAKFYDQGNAYFVDLEGALNEFGVSVSNDNGNTWRKNPAAVQQSVVDRQWYAVDNGPSASAVDNSVFLAFHETAVGTFIYSSPGSTGPTDPVGGLVFQNSAGLPGPLQALADDAI